MNLWQMILWLHQSPWVKPNFLIRMILKVATLWPHYLHNLPSARWHLLKNHCSPPHAHLQSWPYQVLRNSQTSLVQMCLQFLHPVHWQPIRYVVGDNIDKNIKPRDMKSDHQMKSLHYFHLYVVRDHIDLSKYEDNPSLLDIASINTEQLLPSEEDAQILRSNFAMHIARVLKHMKFFKQFGSGLERHIRHKYYAEMSKKSKVVSKCLLCGIVFV